MLGVLPRGRHVLSGRREAGRGDLAALDCLHGRAGWCGLGELEAPREGVAGGQVVGGVVDERGDYGHLAAQALQFVLGNA
ncbi:hypothetical protein QF035_000030 [Streptomyces umbrinus]|uniref:Uncharacterized protein n=1 Tax=Streptomyces umbrinus TaxID=67370 RepID=A0ABU0SG25_9ACTN|nr:hypothetical protein [Streptomyces umbrinus]MDQ1022448.1 hypothetical protein [Streptomyces umbrinus]